jgi:hypothetical protein
MKKVLMLSVLILGTTAMVNAQTTPVKTAPAKETKMVKHSRKKAEKTQAVSKTEAPTTKK